MNRTGIDFSKHNYTVEKYTNAANKEIRVDRLQIDNDQCLMIQFMNTDENLIVTGDFGDWIFCRPFIPSAQGMVSDSYWLEKLQIANSNMEIKPNYNWEEIKQCIEEKIAEIKDDLETEIEEDSKNELKEYLEELHELYNKADYGDFLEYLHYAYRETRHLDSEWVTNYKNIPGQLLLVFDAFDEICRRIKGG